ncbi:uncharacterized protein N7459_006601 [Penicillium hispanicum]|uniref:uncharacterized protein n=1 Tax=Penicillium hispanicum TaxID=1080232 RepID=UPI002541473B|nr:uncharacterized protein N7459_006601 [Penicillium hispanicum]KAJ5577637.1 hypothetical protein N7459_006601 [Penicillium hispanicum]
MQSAIQFSPVKDGRRILGEKDSNACLSPAHQNKHSLSVAGTPTKRTLFTSVSPKKLLPSPVFAGQKRTRDQVDETDVNNGHLQASRGIEQENAQSTIQYANEQLHQEPHAMESRVSTPVPQPQRDEPQRMETQRSPTASQTSDEETRSIPEDPDARRLFIQQKAALLRNTLQTAMRNVTDHQIDRRVSELEAHSRKAPRLSFSTLSSSPSVSYRKTATPSQFRTPRIGSMPDMSSTPCQQTPDLPRPASMVNHADRVKPSQRTPPRTLGSPMQLSSPPATVVRHSRTRDVNEDGGPEQETAACGHLSPSQRGDAVDGLLKLMSTADSHESSDSWTG